MSYTWQVKGARVKIKILEAELEKSDGGILLATGVYSKDDLEVGEVVGLGDLAYAAEDKPWAEIGDIVMFQRYAGKPIKEGRDLYRIIKDIDVIATRKTIKEAEKCQ